MFGWVKEKLGSAALKKLRPLHIFYFVTGLITAVVSGLIIFAPDWIMSLM